MSIEDRAEGARERFETYSNGRLRGALELGKTIGKHGSPRRAARRLRAGQGLTGEMQAVIGFFALAVVGIFVVSKIDEKLPSAAGENYTDAANQTAVGFKDTIDIAVVVPLVVFAGLILGVIMRFV